MEDENILNEYEGFNQEATGVVSPKRAIYEPFEFRGDAKEFFKIWIVNIALSVITLGIYSAWAKVRTNRYIYGNTFLNNSNFEFNADPKRILYGRVIVVSFYGLFLLATNVLYSNTMALGVVVIFLLLFPWLARQAISFRLKSASYRNIHFKFKGSIKSFYILSILFIIVTIIAILPFFAQFIGFASGMNTNYDLIGLLWLAFWFIYAVVIIPIFYKKLKSLIINNSYYGKHKFEFEALKSEAIGLFFKMGLLTSAAGFIIGIIMVAGAALIEFISKQLGLTLNSYITIFIVYFAGISFYLSLIAMYKGISDAMLSNFTRDHTEIEGCKLKGEIHPVKLGFISFTNTFAIIFSLGLLYPWAKMRYLRYKAEHTLFKCNNYDKFLSDGRDNASTIGEETMDFFDIDIGV